MPKRALFAGDANVDFQLTGLAGEPLEDREVFCEDFLATLGGSTTLAAAAYARLGGACDFCGLVGDDENGRLVSSYLAAAGVGIDSLRITRERKTGVTVNLVRGSTRTQVTYPGTLAIVDEAETIIGMLASYSHIHVSGPYGTPRFLPRVRAVLEAARAGGLTTSLDPQWDPSGEWSRSSEWLPLLSFLFVNEAEAASMTGTGAGEEAKAWALLAERTECPIIKLGSRGAYAGGRAFPAFEVDVVDPTGAGDTFAAAFIYASVEEGAPMPEAAAFAQAAGALACGYAGGSSPLLTRAAVLALLR